MKYQWSIELDPQDKPKCSSNIWIEAHWFRKFTPFYPSCSQPNKSPTSTLILKLKSSTIWTHNIMAKLALVLLLKFSVSSSILDHQTCGSHQKNADCQLHAIFINISTAPKVPAMSTMEVTLILLMVQEESSATLAKTPLMSLVFKPRTHCSDKLLD